MLSIRTAMPQNSPAQIDDFDHKILIELERDGILTAAALSERVGLSPSACHRRVKAMEEAGVIEGYAAILSEKALGRSATVFVAVTLPFLATPASASVSAISGLSVGPNSRVLCNCYALACVNIGRLLIRLPVAANSALAKAGAAGGTPGSPIPPI